MAHLRSGRVRWVSILVYRKKGHGPWRAMPEVGLRLLGCRRICPEVAIVVASEVGCRYFSEL